MTILTIMIPDDEVDAVTLRRQSTGQWIATASHRFGFVRDEHGSILGPTAPHGVGTSTNSAEQAWDLALADLRKEVAAKLAEQNAGPSRVGQYPRIVRDSNITIPLDLDLEL